MLNVAAGSQTLGPKAFIRSNYAHRSISQGRTGLGGLSCFRQNRRLYDTISFAICKNINASWRRRTRTIAHSRQNHFSRDSYNPSWLHSKSRTRCVCGGERRQCPCTYSSRGMICMALTRTMRQALYVSKGIYSDSSKSLTAQRTSGTRVSHSPETSERR